MRIHIVQKGDTLWKIARQHGISFEDLKRLNAHLANPDYIVPGMEIVLPETTLKHGTMPIKEVVKEQVVKSELKEQPIVPIPVKEKPIKETPIKEKPLPTPIPAPIPQQPLPPTILPIEIPWTPPAQPMHIDFFNMTHMPDVNVQMDMQIPQQKPIMLPQHQPQIQPIIMQQPQPIVQHAEPQQITHYVQVPMPIPIHVPHIVHQPCRCQSQPHPQEYHCKCREPHPMHLPIHQHCMTPYMMQPELQMQPTTWPSENQALLAGEDESMEMDNMPAIDERYEDGWRFPESSSCSSSFRNEHFLKERVRYCPPQPNVEGGWQPYPVYPQMQPYIPVAPYPGVPSQPMLGGSPWMMPY